MKLPGMMYESEDERLHEMRVLLGPLALLRRVMTCIHEGGSIFYYNDRKEAYSIVAKIASDMRNEKKKENE